MQLLRNNLGRFEKGNKGYWLGKHLPEEMRQKHSRLMKGKKASPETKKKLTESMKNRYKNGWVNPMTGRIGEKHPRWKGNEVCYDALHIWIHNRKGKPEICQSCGKTTGWLHWASIDNSYTRNLDDWISLCVPCHKRFDGWAGGLK